MDASSPRDRKRVPATGAGISGSGGIFTNEGRGRRGKVSFTWGKRPEIALVVSFVFSSDGCRSEVRCREVVAGSRGCVPGRCEGRWERVRPAWVEATACTPITTRKRSIYMVYEGWLVVLYSLCVLTDLQFGQRTLPTLTFIPFSGSFASRRQEQSEAPYDHC